jgi:hypothetical protein
MFEILLGLLALTFASIYLLNVTCRTQPDAKGFTALICLMLMILTAVHLGKMYSYEKAESTALVINRTYGTAYTKHEVYHAEDVIELIRELHKADAEVKVEEE